MTGGTVCCFLCKATVFYQKDDRLQLQDHLRSEHETEDEEGLEYLIAGCLMNSEERQAIVNVVKDREPDNEASQSVVLDESNMMIISDVRGHEKGAPEEDSGRGSDDSSVSISALVPETNLQEGAEGEPGELADTLSTSARARGECSPPRPEEKLPVEFRCLECGLMFNLKIRLNRHMKNHAKKREMMDTMLSVKAEMMTPNETSTPTKTLSKTPSTKTPTSKKISVKVESASKKPRGPPKNYIEPPAGEGVACPDCGKRFRSQGPMMRHREDLHQPGEYPCRGCGRVFSSKNKVSSHYSRNCKGRNRMSL